MHFPKPFPGLVLNYAYLWQHESKRGQIEGVKDRPCVVVTAIVNATDGIKVYVSPITHRPALNPQEAVEIPHTTKTRLGLDDDQSWVTLTEVNSFIWPGFDLRPIPGKEDWDCVFGVLPPGLFQKIKTAIVGRAKANKLQAVGRQ